MPSAGRLLDATELHLERIGRAALRCFFFACAMNSLRVRGERIRLEY